MLLYAFNGQDEKLWCTGVLGVVSRTLTALNAISLGVQVRVDASNSCNNAINWMYIQHNYGFGVHTN